MYLSAPNQLLSPKLSTKPAEELAVEIQEHNHGLNLTTGATVNENDFVLSYIQKMPKNDEILFRVNIGRAALRILDVHAPPGTVDGNRIF
jgi:hypothetical protein